MSTPGVLQDLLTAAGPPGHEATPAAVWREAAEAFGADVTVDAMGTSVARVGGRGERPLLAVVATSTRSRSS
jgi:putative aminopeptidase FrvX